MALAGRVSREVVHTVSCRIALRHSNSARRSDLFNWSNRPCTYIAISFPPRLIGRPFTPNMITKDDERKVYVCNKCIWILLEKRAKTKGVTSCTLTDLYRCRGRSWRRGDQRRSHRLYRWVFSNGITGKSTWCKLLPKTQWLCRWRASSWLHPATYQSQARFESIATIAAVLYFLVLHSSCVAFFLTDPLQPAAGMPEKTPVSCSIDLVDSLGSYSLY